MKTNHKIYLSLGSNLGNKFENLQLAVNAIFEEIGSIKKIAPIFETPAMGFEGKNFLNCVIQVETNQSAILVLDTILSIETKLGRVREEKLGYSSRKIDIDMLFYDDAIINTKSLIIPHPEIQNRKFVLAPLELISPDFIHPILNKSISKILEVTLDNSELIKYSKWLRNPILDFDMSKFRYVAIEGNIGAGKTSLATQLASDFNTKLVLERFKENPFLPEFYKDPDRFAFPLEMSFLADRYQQLLDDLTQYDLFKENVIGDYDAYKSLIFAKITLQEQEFILYKKLYQITYKELPKPDAYVYLYQNTERLLQNIKNRGRDFEQEIEASYLQKINEGYMEFIKNQHIDTIKIIDISEMDFVNNRFDYIQVLNQIIN
ncbi:MAG: 2-amino-4-hydroxy-6-hydroxymethyldihydropteridine diphosphokinase [Candidatus Marinimicrobia bacterium]|nr:2-amino-4-hydroxy-6-hydroxymethyldihydropteridine diphosphokinase [Candidatus Neomarinimicrobiota bacterium]